MASALAGCDAIDPIRTLPPAIIVAYSFAMDDVISQTSYGAEFDFESDPVGLFRDQAFPIEPGEYAYEPYRGPGHYEMQRALSSGAEVICKYMLNDQRVSFRVLSYPPLWSPESLRISDRTAHPHRTPGRVAGVR